MLVEEGGRKLKPRTRVIHSGMTIRILYELSYDSTSPQISKSIICIAMRITGKDTAVYG
jgi:hypothetical protein